MKEIRELKTKLISLDEIIPYENNAKEHPDWQIAQIKNSIEKFGFNDPIAVNENMGIIEGHGRYLAAKELGLKEVPCIILSGMTADEERAYIIAHNKLTMNTGFDLEVLEYELNALQVEDFDLSLTGFEDKEIDDILDKDDLEDEFFDNKQDIVEDDIPEPPKKIFIKSGDLIELGNHRILCGDSTSENDIERLLNGQKAHLVFTDPPYGMKKEKDGVTNDNLNFSDLLEFNKRWIPLSFKYLTDVGSWYCWGIDEPLMDIYSEILKPMIKNNELTFRNLITWDKGNGQGQNSDKHRMYPIADEKCLFVMKGVQGFNNNADNYYEGWEPIRLYLLNEWRKISDKNDWGKYLGNCMGKHYFTKSQWLLPTEEQYKKLQEIGREYGAFKREYEDIKREYYKTRAYFDNTHDNMNNVWHFDRVAGKDRDETGGHATPKPLDLCSRAIKSSSRENENVLDLFGGSGSTLIACEQLGRKSFLMELEPKWVQVIIERYINFTKEDNIKINGEYIEWEKFKNS